MAAGLFNQADEEADTESAGAPALAGQPELAEPSPIAGAFPTITDPDTAARVQSVMAQAQARAGAAAVGARDDSITRLLKRHAASDPARDFLSAVSMSAKMPLGEALNKLRAGQIVAAEALAKHELARTTREQTQATQALRLDLATQTAAARQRSTIANAVSQAIKAYDIPPAQMAAVAEGAYQRIASAGLHADPMAAFGAVGASAQALGVPLKRTSGGLQEKIAEVRAQFPQLAQEEAAAIALGAVRITQDEDGNPTVTNLGTGRSYRPQAAGAQPPAAPGQPSAPVPSKTGRAGIRDENVQYDRMLKLAPGVESALADAIGTASKLGGIAAGTLGQLPSGSVSVPGVGEIGTGKAAVDERVVAARQRLADYRQLVIESLRNTRLSNQQQTRLLNLVPDPESWRQSPDEARVRFREFQESLRQRIEVNRGYLGEGKGEPPAASALPDTPEAVREAYRKKLITREQARERLKALGMKLDAR